MWTESAKRETEKDRKSQRKREKGGKKRKKKEESQIKDYRCPCSSFLFACCLCEAVFLCVFVDFRILLAVFVFFFTRIRNSFWIYCISFPVYFIFSLDLSFLPFPSLSLLFFCCYYSSSSLCSSVVSTSVTVVLYSGFIFCRSLYLPFPLASLRHRLPSSLRLPCSLIWILF